MKGGLVLSNINFVFIIDTLQGKNTNTGASDPFRIPIERSP